MQSLYGTQTGVNLARKHIGWYTKGLPGSAEFRNQVNQQDDPKVVIAMLRDFYSPWLRALRGLKSAAQQTVFFMQRVHARPQLAWTRQAAESELIKRPKIAAGWLASGRAGGSTIGRRLQRGASCCSARWRSATGC